MTKSEKELIEAALALESLLGSVDRSERAKKATNNFLSARRRVARELLELRHPAWRDEIFELHEARAKAVAQYEALDSLLKTALDDEELNSIYQRFRPKE